MTMSPAPLPVVLVMGVSGSGKTTVGRLLAARLGVPFVDGDDLHPRSNVVKMAGLTPLDDEDRLPWLNLVRAEIARALEDREGLVVACSALKRDYRDRLVRPGEPIRVIFLAGDANLIAGRLSARNGHFMPPRLLASQFEALEPPEDAIRLDVRQGPEVLVDEIVSRFGGAEPSST